MRQGQRNSRKSWPGPLRGGLGLHSQLALGTRAHPRVHGSLCHQAVMAESRPQSLGWLAGREGPLGLASRMSDLKPLGLCVLAMNQMATQSPQIHLFYRRL